MAVLILGLLGRFRPVPLLILFTLAGAAGRWPGVTASLKKILGYALTGVPLIAVAALAPPFFYDAWVYHLGLPWQALQDGAIRAHPDNLFSTFPPLAQLIYALPLAAGAVRAPALIHFFGYCAAALAARALASRLGAPPVPAFLVGVCLLYLPFAPLIAGFPAAESWTVCGILAAVAMALTARRSARCSLAAGWMAGIGAASRIQGISWAALAAVAWLTRRRKSVAAMTAFLGAVALGAAPWWLKNTVLLRDPFAPLAWHRGGIETLWRDSHSNLHLAGNLSDLVHQLPSVLMGKAWILVPLFAAGLHAAQKRKQLSLLLLSGIGAAGALTWALTGALDRFLVPSVALLLISAACGPGRLGVTVAFLAVGLTLAPGVSSAMGVFRVIGGFSAIGPPSKVYPALLVSNPYPGFLACVELPSSARVLLVAEPRGFLFPRRFESSSQHDFSPLVSLLHLGISPEEARSRLVGLGYTHLLVNVPEMRRLGKTYPVLPWTDPDSQAAFVALTHSLGRPAILVGDLVVYSLISGNAH
ncbi:MAG: hypothetical protein L0191_17330 [Acidobacteria bacterium]|nr:hypothetical protein [Acidobacteriota bacterium]